MVNKILVSSWTFIFLINLRVVAYSAEIPRPLQIHRPLFNLIDYAQIFEPQGATNAIIGLKRVVLERAIAKGIVSLPAEDGPSVGNWAKKLSAAEFFRILLDDAMIAERRAITTQLQIWDLEMQKVIRYFRTSLDFEPPLLKNFESIHATLSKDSWVLPDLLWYYFAMEERAEDHRVKVQFKNAMVNDKTIFSGGSVLLAWPSSLYSILFPRNFFGHPMPRNDQSLTTFDQVIVNIGKIMEEFAVEPRDRMAIYALLSEIRKNPALILSPEFATSVIQKENGARILSLLDELNQIAAARNRLFMSAYLKSELAKRPVITKTFAELGIPEGTLAKLHASCWHFFGKLFRKL